MKTISLVLFFVSNLAYAGGVICKSCPAESDACMPKPGCHQNYTLTQGLAPHCATYFKLKNCQQQCGVVFDAQNILVNQPCVDSCMQQLCR